MFKKAIQCKEVFWFLAGHLLPVKAGGVILTYHSVAKNEAFFTVAPETFKKQMEYLRKGDWNVVSLKTLVSLVISQKKIPKKTVVVTFDDAYVDFLENALPILEKYQIPVTIFLPTGLVGKKMINREGFTFSILNWEQLKKLSTNPLIEIGSHTKNHPILTEITDQELLQFELKESKKEIENGLGITCNFFAYPKGKSDKKVRGKVSKMYLAGVGTKPGKVIGRDTDLSELCRVGVYQYTSFSRFKLLLKR
jgi:peptidoglycan/xylan/chitin deacetylase (PgdA/CDA1 family)